jgi:hydroxyethylthiazole kinase
MNTGMLLDALRSKRPLVHHITNMVTVNECANVTLVVGGLPIMAHAPEEVAEMVEHSGALVLNIGTLTPAQVEAMLKAGRRANELKIPIVLDPVGAGATALRSESSKRLLAELQIGIIKGNAAEIAVLAGGVAEIKGVESIAVEGNVAALAAQLATATGAVVAVTGQVDLVTDGVRLIEIANGHPLMGTVVGTGCMSASLCGCFAAVEEDLLKAAAAALTVFGVAAELAAQKKTQPAAFRTALFDELYSLSTETVNEMQKMTERKISP